MKKILKSGKMKKAKIIKNKKYYHVCYFQNEQVKSTVINEDIFDWKNRIIIQNNKEIAEEEKRVAALNDEQFAIIKEMWEEWNSRLLKKRFIDCFIKNERTYTDFYDFQREYFLPDECEIEKIHIHIISWKEISESDYIKFNKS